MYNFAYYKNLRNELIEFFFLIFPPLLLTSKKDSTLCCPFASSLRGQDSHGASRLWMPRSPRALRASRLVLRELWQSHQVLILPPTSTNKREERPIGSLFPFLYCGGRIRTCDLRVMSPTRCHFSTPRYKERTLPCPFLLFGDYLLSQAVSNQVPSAM